MVEVRPDEVSAILRQQLAGFKSESELEEVGYRAPGGRWYCACIWFNQSTFRRIGSIWHRPWKALCLTWKKIT